MMIVLVMKVKFMKRRVPKGTSDYQAGWILDADEEDGEYPDEGDDDDEEGFLLFFLLN